MMKAQCRWRKILRLIGQSWAAYCWAFCVAGREASLRAQSLREELAWQLIEAADATICRIEGQHSIQIYPRSVERRCVFLFAGSRLTVATQSRAVYLRLPTVFSTPGPRYA